MTKQEIRVHVIDPESTRRAEVARLLYSSGLHAEIYEGLWEFLERVPVDGVVLVFSSSVAAEMDEVSELLRRKAMHLPFAFYASAPNVEDVVRAMKSGASAFLEWPFELKRLREVVGEIQKHAARERRVASRIAEAAKLVARLSPRERDVLKGLLNGDTNKDIARQYGISPRTVEIHRSNLMKKLKARSTADAVRVGIYAGLDEEQSGPSNLTGLRLVATRR